MSHQPAVGVRRHECAAGARLSIILAFTLVGLAPADGRAQSLPSGWAVSNIGSPALAGRGAYASDTFTLDGAGTDVWGVADQFVYAHRQITGDVRIVARVTSLENTHQWVKGGIMIRESLSAGSKHAFALASASKGIAFQRRSATGGITTHSSGGTGAAPVWLLMERRGSTFTASRSADGVTWTLIGSAAITMTPSVYVGLAVTSHAPTVLATAKFANVQVTSPLPTGWSSADIGSPAIKGSVSYSNSAFTIRAGGRDIWDTSDQFTFAYRQVSGDVDVIARVSSVQATDRWTKAGVMIRDSLRSSAAHASMFASAARGLAFQRRAATGLPSLHTSGGTGTAPVWLKLERRGTAITAFHSANGTTWTMVGSETLTLPATFYVGLAVTSHNASASATAVIGNVTVTQRGTSPGNTPPAVSLTAPVSGASFVAPASITLSATASDVNGSIARVEFYRGSTLIAADTSSPYSVNWTNVPAGSYGLTAVAFDNAGASTTSAATAVIVQNAGSPVPLTTAVFNPSSDHSTSRVTSYSLEIFTAGVDPNTATAIGRQSVGKPSIVNGECRANIATTINGLPSGRYVATIAAVGPGGTSGRAVSEAFQR